MTTEEVILYLSQLVEDLNRKLRHMSGQPRKDYTRYMNAAAEAAVLLMEVQEHGRA